MIIDFEGITDYFDTKKSVSKQVASYNDLFWQIHHEEGEDDAKEYWDKIMRSLRRALTRKETSTKDKKIIRKALHAMEDM